MKNLTNRIAKMYNKIISTVFLLLVSVPLLANVQGLDKWKDDHVINQGSAFLDIAFWGAMIMGVIFIIVALLTWRSLTSGNPSQKAQQAGGTGVAVGLLIGGFLLGLSTFIGVTTGTATGQDDYDKAYTELRKQ